MMVLLLLLIWGVLCVGLIIVMCVLLAVLGESVNRQQARRRRDIRRRTRELAKLKRRASL